MALSDFISPTLEGFLSAIPQLVGAYESARGKPIGTVLQTLGQFGTQNAGNRTQKKDVGALQQLVSSFNAQNAPIAAGLYQKLQSVQDQMSPDMLAQQLGNIQQVGEREQIKTPRLPQKFFNQATGQTEYHDPTSFDNGVVPKNLVGWGPTAEALYKKAMGIETPTDKLKGITPFKAYMEGVLAKNPNADPQEIARQFESEAASRSLGTQLNSFSGKLGMMGKQPASKFGLVPLDPASGRPIAGGTLDDANLNGAISKADLVPYMHANLGIETAKRVKQQAAEINNIAPTILPKAPNLITATGEISIPMLKRFRPDLYQHLQLDVAGLADQLAKTQLGGRAQQAANQMQMMIRDNHSTLTSLNKTVDEAQHILENDKASKLLKGKNQAAATFSGLLGESGTSFGTPSYGDVPDTSPTLPDSGSL